MKDIAHGLPGLVAVGFKAPADLVARADAAATREGITRSDIARRALIRDLERRESSSRSDAA